MVSQNATSAARARHENNHLAVERRLKSVQPETGENRLENDKRVFAYRRVPDLTEQRTWWVAPDPRATR